MQNRFSRVLLISIATVTISVVPAFAQGRGRGRGHENDAGGERYQEHGRRSEHREAFGEHDRDDIIAYYRHHRSDLPPGLARREELPPGLQKYLRRNGHLPPGLQKRIVWFPADLDRELPPLPEGYRRCWVGNNALIVNVRTFGVVDVLASFSINF
jgi:hypothetical protein